MNKKLFTQIKNEWHSNLWIATELLLVSVVMWYVVDYIYVQYKVYTEPRGYFKLLSREHGAAYRQESRLHTE